MSLRFLKNEESLWSERKLLFNHILLNFSPKSYYQIDDFYLPLAYPQSLDIHKEGAAKVLEEITGYSHIGIKMRNIQLSPMFLDIIKALDYDLRDEHLRGKVTLTPKKLLSIPESSLSLMAPHLKFSFTTDPKKQKKAEKEYLEKFVSDKFHMQNDVPILGFEFVEKFFEQTISQMVHLHGKNFQIDLCGIAKTNGSYTDQLVRAFAEYAPTEFSLWQNGKLTVRFLEHLLVWAHLKERLRLTGFDIRTKSGEHSKLYLQIIPQKTHFGDLFTKKSDYTISLIEVLERTGDDRFYIYINRDYYRPFPFRKKTKTGQIIYALAKDGSVEWRGREKTYEYFFQYGHFSLFKKGKYLPTPLLDKLREKDEDGKLVTTHIIPHKEVKFQMITEEEIDRSHQS